jgi:hypothetical protein
MTRRGALLAGLGFPLGTIAFPTLALASKEFWNERKPEDWTAGEVKELLTKSPWAKDAVITDNGLVGGMGVPRAASSRRSVPNGAGGAGQSGPATTSAPKIQWKGIVRWESALPIREAMKGAALKDFKDFYALNVVGNLPSVASSSEESRESSFLQHLKDVTKLEHKGDQVYLSRVELAPGNALSPAGTRFYFSRMLALMPEDKEAMFSTKIGPLDVKCKFTLRDMLYRGALEL